MSEFKLRGQKGNPAYLKQQLMKHRQAGEKALACQFRVKFEGYPNLDILCAASQLPPLKRAMVEGYGPMGTQSNQQGPLENAGVATWQIHETITGDTLRTLRKIIKDGETIPSIRLEITPESAGGQAVGGVELLECSLETDSVDFANDSVTEVVKVPLTINYIWSEEL